MFLQWISADFDERKIYLFISDGCQFYFDLKRHLWSFENTECGRILSFWTGGYMIVIISVLTMITDLLTFYKLRSFNKVNL